VRRLAGVLARRGYPAGLAQRAVREALEADGGDAEGIEEILEALPEE
jgi:regulatory protein